MNEPVNSELNIKIVASAEKIDDSLFAIISRERTKIMSQIAVRVLSGKDPVNSQYLSVPVPI